MAGAYCARTVLDRYLFSILAYLVGIFIFATVVGQLGSVITNRNQTRQSFERMLDNAKNYMRVHNVPQSLQRRVQRWYDYAWSRYACACPWPPLLAAPALSCPQDRSNSHTVLENLGDSLVQRSDGGRR